MFINCKQSEGVPCQIAGFGHTEVTDDPRFQIIGQEQFITDYMSDDGRRNLFGHEPPWTEAEIQSTVTKWEQQTSIRTRIFFSGTTEELGIIAAKKCLDNAGVNASHLDAIIGGTNTGPGYPSLADHVKNALGEQSQAMCFDLAEACTIGGIAVFNGWSLIKSGAKKVLVVCAEKTTILARYDNWYYSNLFGDGAFAFLLSAGQMEDFLAFDINSLPYNGQLNWIRKTENGFVQAGNQVHKFVGTVMVNSLVEFLEKAEIKPENIDHLIPHQPSGKTLNLLETVFRKKYPGFKGKFHRNVETVGNLSSSSTGLLYSQGRYQGIIKKGDLVVILTFGAGLSIGIYAFYAS